MQEPPAARLLTISAVVLVAGSILVGVDARTAFASTCEAIQPPNPGSYNELADVTVRSSSNVWAVGAYDAGSGQSLIVHWDGVAWSRVASPILADSGLSGVASSSSTNLWAVGSYHDGTVSRTLILRGNGSTWRQVASPDPGGSSQGSYLDAVSTTSSMNAWAVGSTFNGVAWQPLILHWNGVTWTRVASPRPGGTSRNHFLNGVTATSSSNAWTVGSFYNGSKDKTLILHWNGTAWRRVPSPSPYFAYFEDVDATSSTDAWAVGLWDDGFSHALIAHWDGTSWTKVASGSGAYPRDVAVTSSTDAWAVGDSDIDGGRGGWQIAVIRWNGASWSMVTTPDLGNAEPLDTLFGVDASSSQNVWAVGRDFDGSEYVTLALHCG
jgi:hypothetical protein